MIAFCLRALGASLFGLALLQDPATDEARTARLRAALDATGLAYETSASGKSFVVRFSHEGGRQQTVFVATKASTPQGLCVHSIYTAVWAKAGEKPDDALVERLVLRAKKLGCFYLFEDDKGVGAIRFGAKFDATDLGAEPKQGDALVQRLKQYIEFVDAVGEETDAELNGDGDVR